MRDFHAVLLVKNAADNPDSLPLDWYRDARKSGPVLDPALLAIGYTLMTDAEFDQYQADHRDEFVANRSARESERVLSDKAKLDALRALFDKCDATAAIWGSATRAQKDDFLEDFYKIIRRQKRQILDQYRPE